MLSPRPQEDAADLPRSQTGANPQHVMAGLLGDFWSDRDEHLPSTTLVDLVRGFGVTTASARAALSRLLRRGTLDVRKNGRNTYYRLSPAARDALDAEHRALVESTRVTAPTWGGEWLVVAFSVSEDRREVRHALRAGLRRLGFGPLYDGVWASPGADPEQLTALLDRLDVRQATVLRSAVVGDHGTLRHPRQVWDLDGLATGYAAFVRTWSPLLDQVSSGAVPPEKALRLRTEAVQAWRDLSQDEPMLPADLLPDGWPREQAVEVLVGVADGLAPFAEEQVRAVLGRDAPELAPLVSARRLGG